MNYKVKISPLARDLNRITIVFSHNVFNSKHRTLAYVLFWPDVVRLVHNHIFYLQEEQAYFASTLYCCINHQRTWTIPVKAVDTDKWVSKLRGYISAIRPDAIEK